MAFFCSTRRVARGAGKSASNRMADVDQIEMTDSPRTAGRTTIDRSPTPIKFGTDGWRAVIADDYTFENVRRVAGAIAAYVLKHEEPSRGLIVGYDTRFGSPSFARAAAEVLASAGIPVRISND